MKVFVYGTLKRGYNNHKLLNNAEFVGEKIIPGFRLFYSHGEVGFPVAQKDDSSSVKGEIYEVNDFKVLDQLEGEGFMYDRIFIDNDTQMYVGNKRFWDFSGLTSCPKDENNIFVWNR